MTREALERLFELVAREVHRLDALLFPLGRLEHAHALHLVKHGEVRGVDGVAAVDVSGDEELRGALLEHLELVRGSVAAEDVLAVDVVGVVGGARDVVGGNEDAVEVGVG